MVNIAPSKMKPERLGEWAYTLRPDFIGPVSGGWFGCLITWTNEHENPAQGQTYWAFGIARNPVDAREQAVATVVEQRMTQITWELTV